MADLALLFRPVWCQPRRTAEAAPVSLFLEPCFRYPFAVGRSVGKALELGSVDIDSWGMFVFICLEARGVGAVGSKRLMQMVVMRGFPAVLRDHDVYLCQGIGVSAGLALLYIHC